MKTPVYSIVIAHRVSVVLALCCAALLPLVSCGGGGSGGGSAAAPERGDLMAVTSTSTIDESVVDATLVVMNQLGYDVSALAGTYGVSLNRIVYKTQTPDGRLIDASGVVAYPLKFGGARSPVLSYQHATIVHNNEAPSQLPSDSNDPILTVLAGTGFVVVMADYIGYGASQNETHPYVQAAGSAAAVVDMLRAARRLLANQGVATNGQLFLTGYSEGGYVALAAQKEMEQNLSSEFSITASMPAAGPYDMAATAQHIVGLTTNDQPVIVSFVFKAYDRWYGWGRLSELFQAPYRVPVSTYFDGNHTSGEIQAALTTDSASLFTTSFRNAFLGSGEPTVKAAFTANNIYNWAPVSPTRLFHGEDDEVVPYFNAINAVTAMTTAGSTSVTLVNCAAPAGLRGHEACAPFYLGEVFNWFATLATDL